MQNLQNMQIMQNMQNKQIMQNMQNMQNMQKMQNMPNVQNLINHEVQSPMSLFNLADLFSPRIWSSFLMKASLKIHKGTKTIKVSFSEGTLFYFAHYSQVGSAFMMC